jgi:hypothetical protein
MLKAAAGKVMWVGRATVFLVGLAVILVILFGVTSMLLGANRGPSLSGDYNQIDPITQLAGSGAGMNLNVDPLAMRRQVEFPRGYAQVNVTPTTVTLTGSKGVNDVKRSTTDNSVYCLDLNSPPERRWPRPTSTTTPQSGRYWGVASPRAVRRPTGTRRPGPMAATRPP